MFWEHQVLRSLKSPQKVHKVLKKSRKCTKGTQGPQTSGSQLILKMSSNSSKGQQSPRSPQRSTKGIQDDLNSSKRYQRRQNPVVVKSSQMFIKWSSKSPQNFLKTVLKWSTRSHQKFQKGSSMFWEHQVLRSLKSPQKVHKVLKKSRKCTKGTQGPQTSGSQLILKISSISSKGPKSLEVLIGPQKVFQSTSKSPRSYQRRQNPVVVKSSSNVH